MEFSRFGDKFTGHSGILQLMDDLGNAVAGDKDVIMLGGGNPSHIPSVQRIFRERMVDILENGDEFEHLVGDYDPPAGNPGFREDVAALLNDLYGWPVTGKNIALTNGSQTAFFYLFNLLGGENAQGEHKKILLPLAPEYIGYVDAGIDDNGDLYLASWTDSLAGEIDSLITKVSGADGSTLWNKPILGSRTDPIAPILPDSTFVQVRSFDVDSAGNIVFAGSFANDTGTEGRPCVTCSFVASIDGPEIEDGLVVDDSADQRQTVR